MANRSGRRSDGQSDRAGNATGECTAEPLVEPPVGPFAPAGKASWFAPRVAEKSGDAGLRERRVLQISWPWLLGALWIVLSLAIISHDLIAASNTQGQALASSLVVYGVLIAVSVGCGWRRFRGGPVRVQYLVWVWLLLTLVGAMVAVSNLWVAALLWMVVTLWSVALAWYYYQQGERGLGFVLGIAVVVALAAYLMYQVQAPGNQPASGPVELVLWAMWVGSYLAMVEGSGYMQRAERRHSEQRAAQTRRAERLASHRKRRRR